MALIAVLLLACAPKVRDRGFEPSVSTAEALSQALEPRRRALVIGVDDYVDPAFPDLRHARHDAEALAEVLTHARGGGFDEVVTLLDPDRDAVVRAVVEAREELRREDTLVVYFSGHGTRVEDGRRFLLTADARPGDLSGTALELGAFQQFFSALPPARKALIVDACFSGDGKSVARPNGAASDAESPFVSGLAALGPGEAQLFATSPGRPAREDDRLGHGVYTWYLLDALSWASGDADLDEDGVITAYEAHDHARGRAIEHTGGDQVPEAAFRVVGEADVVLTGDSAARAGRDRALVYLYPASEHPMTGTRVVVDGRDRGALPGTVAVPSGRHQVALRDPSGEVVVEGSMVLARGRSYRADDIERLVAGPTHGLGVRATAVASAPLRAALGPGLAGLELWGSQRASRGPHRGLYGEWTLGAGTATSRSRPAGWASAAIGHQGDVGRLRHRMGWGVSAAWVPPSWDTSPPDPVVLSEHPDAIGWVLTATGPSLGAGVVLSDGWVVNLALRPHVAALDADLDGKVTAVPWIAASAGVEMAW